MEMLMNDKRRSGNSGSFADIGDLDKLESELNEIKGTKVLVRRALVLKMLSGFSNIALTTTRKRSIRNQIPTLNCDVRHHRREVRRDGIDVPTKFRLPATFLQITATAKKGVKKDDRQAGRVVFKGANKKQFAVHVGFQL
jgi:hypothetical protein